MTKEYNDAMLEAFIADQKVNNVEKCFLCFNVLENIFAGNPTQEEWLKWQAAYKAATAQQLEKDINTARGLADAQIGKELITYGQAADMLEEAIRNQEKE